MMSVGSYFIQCEQQTSLKNYFQEVIQQTGATSEHLAREFQIGLKTLSRVIGPTDNTSRS
jgi:hypothetical protein